MMLSIIGAANCSQTPTTPTPTPTPDPMGVASVTPAEPSESALKQVLTVTGLGFKPGLVLRVTSPAGATTSAQGADIRNLTSTAFEASVILSAPGVHTLVVRQADGQESRPYSLKVLAAPGPPQIDAVSPTLTTANTSPQLVTLLGSGFDSSLRVQIIDPDSVVTQLTAANLTKMTSTVIEFSTVLNKVGLYTISLWTATGPASNSVTIGVQ